MSVVKKSVYFLFTIARGSCKVTGSKAQSKTGKCRKGRRDGQKSRQVDLGKWNPNGIMRKHYDIPNWFLESKFICPSVSYQLFCVGFAPRLPLWLSTLLLWVEGREKDKWVPSSGSKGENALKRFCPWDRKLVVFKNWPHLAAAFLICYLYS